MIMNVNAQKYLNQHNTRMQIALIKYLNKEHSYVFKHENVFDNEHPYILVEYKGDINLFMYHSVLLYDNKYKNFFNGDSEYQSIPFINYGLCRNINIANIMSEYINSNLCKKVTIVNSIAKIDNYYQLHH